MAAYQRFTGGIRSSGAPATLGIIALHVVGFLILWISEDKARSWFLFDTNTALQDPWTFITYAFTNVWIASVVLGSLWLYMVGSMVERDLGSAKFVSVFLIFTVLPALVLFIGAQAMNRWGLLIGFWVPVSAITVIWGTRYPDLVVRIFCIFPVKAKYIAMFSAAMVFFDTEPRRMGIFVAIPLILAWAYAADKLPVKYGKYSRPVTKGKTRFRVRDEDSYFDDVKRREREREERDRLKKLFEDSMGDEER